MALDPAEPYTHTPQAAGARTLVTASNWAAPDWGQEAKMHQRKEPR